MKILNNLINSIKIKFFSKELADAYEAGFKDGRLVGTDEGVSFSSELVENYLIGVSQYHSHLSEEEFPMYMKLFFTDVVSDIVKQIEENGDSIIAGAHTAEEYLESMDKVANKLKIKEESDPIYALFG